MTENAGPSNTLGGGQCYNCLNGAHENCPACGRKNDKRLGLRIGVIPFDNEVLYPSGAKRYVASLHLYGEEVPNSEYGSVCRCYKHYCRSCHAEHYVKFGIDEYPTCCGRVMAFLGVVDHTPGRSEENQISPNKVIIVHQEAKLR